MSFTDQSQAYAPAASPDSGDDDSQSQTATTEDVPQPDIGNIDKIREIIFGGQMRDYEKRFTRVEERLIKESQDLREDTTKRFEVLEKFIKTEFATVADRLQAEHRTRDEAVQSLWRGVHELVQTMNAKLTELQEQSAGAQSDLRQQILAQSQDLSHEIRQKQDELKVILQREVAELNHEKTDRSSLATLLTEMALRLNNDLKKPE